MFKDLYRLVTIGKTLRKYRIDQHLVQNYNLTALRWLKLGFWWVARVDAQMDFGSCLKGCCEELGPLAVKLGQLLSLQHDLLTPAVTTELASLQDDVAIQDQQALYQHLRDILPSELITSRAIVLDESQRPLASASVASVFKAYLNRSKLAQLDKRELGNGAFIYQFLGVNEQVVEVPTQVIQATSETAQEEAAQEEASKVFSQTSLETTAVAGVSTQNGETSSVEAVAAAEVASSATVTSTEEVTATEEVTVTLKEAVVTRSQPEGSTASEQDTGVEALIPVIVKVIRPQVRQAIERDLSILQRLLDYIARHFDHKGQLRAQEIYQELADNFTAELNLSHEANNAYIFKQQWHESPLLYIPQVFVANRDFLVLEYIQGTRLTKDHNLGAQGVNVKLLAQRGVEIFFTQLLKYNHFHADMHPGNIWLDLSDKEAPRYKAVDFGIVGFLSEQDRRYLIENLLAFFKQDYKKIVKLHMQSGWTSERINPYEMELRVQEVLAQMANQPLSKISFGVVLQELFAIGRDFGMQVQPQLLLLQKTLVYIEHMGRSLYPDLDLWETAQPFLEKWLAQEYSFTKQSKQLTSNIPYLLNSLNQLPDYLYLNKQKIDKLTNKVNYLEKMVRSLLVAVVVLLLILLLVLLLLK